MHELPLAQLYPFPLCAIMIMIRDDGLQFDIPTLRGCPMLWLLGIITSLRLAV